MTALAAETKMKWIYRIAIGANFCKFSATFTAKLETVRIFSLTLRTFHLLLSREEEDDWEVQLLQNPDVWWCRICPLVNSRELRGFKKSAKMREEDS
jgi:hypothetical protein